MTTKKNKNVKDEVVWCDRGFLPVNYCFCPSQKAWNKLMKEFGIQGHSEEYDQGGLARMHLFTNDDIKYLPCCVVTLNENQLEMFNSEMPVVPGLLLHEGMHVWQAQLEYMVEDKPGHEMEAYGVQFIFYNLFNAFLKTRADDWKFKP